MNRITAGLTACLCCVGCVGTLDSVSTARGQLVRLDGAELNGCVAIPYRSDTKARLSNYERKVDSRFLVSMVNAPSGGRAFIEFTCPDQAETIRSIDFSLAEASNPNGIDIGRVVAPK